MIDARIIKRLPATQGSEPFELNIHLRSESAVTVLLGASGAAKTLTLNCLAGFAHPDEGRILVQDQLFFDVKTLVLRSSRRRLRVQGGSIAIAIFKRCWKPSNWRIYPAGSRIRFRGAKNSALPSRELSSSSRACCCWMSRREAWMRGFERVSTKSC